MRMICGLFLGIALIVAGTAVLTYEGITVTTAERQLLHIGPLQAATEQSNWTITLPPILGAIVLFGGIALVFATAIIKRLPNRKEKESNTFRTPAGWRMTEAGSK